MRIIVFVLFALILCPSEAWLQTRKPASLPERGLTTEKYETEIEHWEKLLRQIGYR